MASKPGRKLGYYLDPPGRLIKAILHVLIKQKHDRSFVLYEFKRLLPDYNILLKRPVTDGGLWGRADVGVRAGYEREHPDKEPAALPFLPIARAIVAEGTPVSPVAFRDWLARVATESVPEPATTVSGEQPQMESAPTPPRVSLRTALPAAHRRAAIAQLHAAGKSTREIAKVVGLNQSNVVRQLAKLKHGLAEAAD